MTRCDESILTLMSQLIKSNLNLYGHQFISPTSDLNLNRITMNHYCKSDRYVKCIGIYVLFFKTKNHIPEPNQVKESKRKGVDEEELEDCCKPIDGGLKLQRDL